MAACVRSLVHTWPSRTRSASEASLADGVRNADSWPRDHGPHGGDDACRRWAKREGPPPTAADKLPSWPQDPEGRVDGATVRMKDAETAMGPSSARNLSTASNDTRGGAVTQDEPPAADGRRQRADGQRSRRRILETAARLATVEGLEGLSIGRLAAATGMSKGGVYAHFGSKEDLQLATIDKAREIFIDVVVLPAAAAPKGVDRLREGTQDRSTRPGQVHSRLGRTTKRRTHRGVAVHTPDRNATDPPVALLAGPGSTGCARERNG